MLTIDGSMGEGGGQILRSALALSLCLNKPFRITGIRAARENPGLRPQHLMAVRAAQQVGNAVVKGAEVGSQELKFQPGHVDGGAYRFDIGTAGSTTLVLQTLLPVLLHAPAAATLELIGGTHNPLAPPYEFIERAFFPVLNRLGARLTAKMERPGFYPVGGGIVRVAIEPVRDWKRLSLTSRGHIFERNACAMLSRLPSHIADRELGVIREALNFAEAETTTAYVQARCPGNAILVTLRAEHVTEVFSAIGQRGVRAETVAARVVDEVQRYLHGDVPVGEHLADQLLLPLVLCGGGEYVTSKPTRHTQTNIDVIEMFTGKRIVCEALDETRWRIFL